MKPAERNQFVADQLEVLIERVNAGEGPAVDRYKNERAVLERLIPIPTDGFRGITLTAILGKMVREDINSSNEFGSIHPRAIFERGIRPILKKYSIPTGASAPLNVAKNVQVIDEKWAEGRKPEDAALAAVDYIRRINSHWGNLEFRDDLILMFIQRLLQYAEEIGQLEVTLQNLDTVAPMETGSKLAKFAVSTPEGGSVPQYLFGLILAFLRSTDTDFEAVLGVNESVFGTNTTSNKPADIWESLANDEAGNYFEVTCKPVDEERLDAAVESFAKQGLSNAPITFVCRMPNDASSLKLTNDVLEYRGAQFQFIDFCRTVEILYLLLTETKRIEVIKRFEKFIADPNRKIFTKKAWSKQFGNN
ncbi:hypothetical protein [Parasphingorhabdus halotolerans]|uniref:SacI restriction endonuclease n=1 Tax=Parasphingorhabdus halotolerans TaxID=2725558 RepID=A0A6H2DLK7_9SPHN|nr:hypothetical protein [Parasphingorhabdus halotolerans]QJB69234.1 hypothetical protein HF685_08025 [Parasphingorhabdus halotolerans]